MPSWESIVDPTRGDPLIAQLQHVWNHLDELAEADPQKYKCFIQQAAQSARAEANDIKKQKGGNTHPSEVVVTIESRVHEAPCGIIANYANITIYGVPSGNMTDSDQLSASHYKDGNVDWDTVDVPLCEWLQHPQPPTDVRHRHVCVSCDEGFCRDVQKQPGQWRALVRSVCKWVYSHHGLKLEETSTVLKNFAIEGGRHLPALHPEPAAAPQEKGGPCNPQLHGTRRQVQAAMPDHLATAASTSGCGVLANGLRLGPSPPSPASSNPASSKKPLIQEIGQFQEAPQGRCTSAGSSGRAADVHRQGRPGAAAATTSGSGQSDGELTWHPALPANVEASLQGCIGGPGSRIVRVVVNDLPAARAADIVVEAERRSLRVSLCGDCSNSFAPLSLTLPAPADASAVAAKLDRRRRRLVLTVPLLAHGSAH